MWIKYCLSKKGSDCPCNDYNEYEIRLKCMKTKLHSRYISFIAVAIVIWLLATGEANTPEFSNWISFASTITSIILSVIAIILSITGESKTDAMRNQMEETAHKLEETAENIKEANDQNIKNTQELKENINVLQKKIESMPSHIQEVLFDKSDKVENLTDENRNRVSKDVKWVKKDE